MLFRYVLFQMAFVEYLERSTVNAPYWNTTNCLTLMMILVSVLNKGTNPQITTTIDLAYTFFRSGECPPIPEAPQCGTPCQINSGQFAALPHDGCGRCRIYDNFCALRDYNCNNSGFGTYYRIIRAESNIVFILINL